MLQSAASRANKEWFEAYLKHVIRYRGLKTPQVVTIVKLWRSNERIGELSLQEQFELAAQLIGAEYAEDKFSGIFYMEKYLVGKIAFKDFFSCAEDLFSKNAFTNWAATDWFNVRVLSPLITLLGRMQLSILLHGRIVMIYGNGDLQFFVCELVLNPLIT